MARALLMLFAVTTRSSGPHMAVTAVPKAIANGAGPQGPPTRAVPKAVANGAGPQGPPTRAVPKAVANGAGPQGPPTHAVPKAVANGAGPQGPPTHAWQLQTNRNKSLQFLGLWATAWLVSRRSSMARLVVVYAAAALPGAAAGEGDGEEGDDGEGDGEEDEDLQSALLQSLADEKGIQHGAGSSGVDKTAAPQKGPKRRRSQEARTRRNRRRKEKEGRQHTESGNSWSGLDGADANEEAYIATWGRRGAGGVAAIQAAQKKWQQDDAAATAAWQQREQEAEPAATQRSAEPAEAREEEAEDPRPAEGMATRHVEEAADGTPPPPQHQQPSRSGSPLGGCSESERAACGTHGNADNGAGAVAGNKNASRSGSPLGGRSGPSNTDDNTGLAGKSVPSEDGGESEAATEDDDDRPSGDPEESDAGHGNSYRFLKPLTARVAERVAQIGTYAFQDHAFVTAQKRQCRWQDRMTYAAIAACIEAHIPSGYHARRDDDIVHVYTTRVESGNMGQLRSALLDLPTEEDAALIMRYRRGEAGYQQEEVSTEVHSRLQAQPTRHMHIAWRVERRTGGLAFQPLMSAISSISPELMLQLAQTNWQAAYVLGLHGPQTQRGEAWAAWLDLTRGSNNAYQPGSMRCTASGRDDVTWFRGYKHV
jgi:hypothetical protein